MKNQKGRIKVLTLILTLILIISLIKAFNLYKTLYFNGFEKATRGQAETKFTRDFDVKYSEDNSYKIENVGYNDSAFYKEIEVEPNTPYRITCMVKTENVQCEIATEEGGATIGLLETTEYSKPIIGTNDWQKVEYMFNSRNRTKVKISFRLGGNQNNCTGEVWFSDFKVEKGIKNTDTHWNVGCFIIKEVDVNIEGKQYNLKATIDDVENVKLNMGRYQQDCYNFSDKKMTVDYEVIEINTPVTSITYSDEQGYFFASKDVEDLIYKTVKEKEFDHVFVVARMENEDGSMSIPIKDNWIGLGGMDMYGIGYSQIRINQRSNTYTYKYGITNQAPEEVYLHEFLHTLERNNIENGYEIPALHDYEKYGYTEKALDGLNEWYQDYMKKRILDKTTNEYVGLDEIVYLTQPPKSINFRYPIDIEFNIEPQNLFEEVITIFKTLGRKK